MIPLYLIMTVLSLFTTEEIPRMNVSYKPQKISPKFGGTVRQLFHTKIRDTYIHPQFITDVIKPLQIENIMDQEVLNLSGGELQRVALTLCLGQVSVRCGCVKECGMYRGFNCRNLVFTDVWQFTHIIFSLQMCT